MIKITKELLDNWFEHDNHWYFNDELRKPNWVISNNRSRFGQFRPRTWTIEISTAYVRSERDYRNTFLHELCHLYVRMNYGGLVQAHGFEWKNIASKVTSWTMGVYGTITCVGGGQDKYVLRNVKASKFVIFTDYNGNLAVAKYSNNDYVNNLKEVNAIQSGSKIYYVISDDVELNKYQKHRVNGWKVRWNKLNFTFEETMKRVELVSTEDYSTLQKVG